jgi:hypothetical protein
MITITSCGIKQNNSVHQQQMQEELTVIDSLLRSEDYALKWLKHSTHLTMLVLEKHRRFFLHPVKTLPVLQSL